MQRISLTRLFFWPVVLPLRDSWTTRGSEEEHLDRSGDSSAVGTELQNPFFAPSRGSRMRITGIAKNTQFTAPTRPRPFQPFRRDDGRPPVATASVEYCCRARSRSRQTTVGGSGA